MFSISEISDVIYCNNTNLDLIGENLKIVPVEDRQRDKLKFLYIKQWIIYFLRQRSSE